MLNTIDTKMETSNKSVVISVSAIATAHNDISKVINIGRTTISVDGSVPHWVRERGTIEDAINEVLKTATKDEAEAAKTIRRAMDEKLADRRYSKIDYFVNDAFVSKTEKLAPYLKEVVLDLGSGNTCLVDMADIRIDKTYMC